MEFGTVQTLYDQASSTNYYEKPSANSSVLSLPTNRVSGLANNYQKPLDFRVFDSAQKFAQVFGTGPFDSSLIQAFSADAQGAEIIPVASTAYLRKEEAADVCFTSGGGGGGDGSCLNDHLGDLAVGGGGGGDLSSLLMDLPPSSSSSSSFDNRDVEDQGWLYSFHDATLFDIGGDMHNGEPFCWSGRDLSTEIRTDTSWSKEIESFLVASSPNASSTTNTMMDLGAASAGEVGYYPNIADDFSELLLFGGGGGHDLFDGVTSATPQPELSSPETVNKPTQAERSLVPCDSLGTWLSADLLPTITPTDSSSEEFQPLVPIAELNSSPSPPPILITPISLPIASALRDATLSAPPTPDASPTPEDRSPADRSRAQRSSKAKSPLLLFGKHESEIMAKLKGVKKTDKRTLKGRLVTMAVEEFNRLLEQSQLTEIEVAFMKEWRRRGKNKCAAQFARRRRKEEMSGLDVEIELLKKQTKEMSQRHEQLTQLIVAYKSKALRLEDQLLRGNRTRDLNSLSNNSMFFTSVDTHTPIFVQ